MKRLAVVSLLFLLSLPSFAQEQQQSFGERIDVSAVLLDVIVTDRRGNQILGLTKDDFVVKEGDTEQTVDSVDYFTSRQLLSGREESAPFKVERVSEDRYFIFFFDKPDGGALQDQLMQARNTVRDFVRKQMKDTDRVAIVGHDVRLKVYSDFTSDRAQLARALNDVTEFGLGITSGNAEGPSILRSADTKAMIDETGTVYEALDFVADQVKSIRARKNLVLFSPGIADRYEQIVNGMITNRSPDLDPMLHSLNASNVTVYPIQLQRDTGIEATPLIHQRLGELADSTGGQYFRVNTSFAPAIKKIENTNSGYYLLTYRAQHPKGEAGYQRVTVKTKNPEFRVTARSGYEFGS
jgi:VWFA-related protein